MFNLGCSIWFFCLQRPADLKSHFHNLMSRKTVAAKLDRTNKVCFHRIKESPDEINERVMSGALTDPRRLYSNLNVMPCNLIVFVWCLFTVSWTAGGVRSQSNSPLFFSKRHFYWGHFSLIIAFLLITRNIIMEIILFKYLPNIISQWLHILGVDISSW